MSHGHNRLVLLVTVTVSD